MTNKVIIECQKNEHAAFIQVTIGNISAAYKRVGARRNLKASGRGNVRQVKALLREFTRKHDCFMS